MVKSNMSFFKQLFRQTEFFSVVSVDIGNLPESKISPFLKLYVQREQGSPFQTLPWDVHLDEIPSHIGDETIQHNIEFDVMLTLVEEKQFYSFFKLTVSLETETITPEWSTYVIMDRANVLKTNLKITKFLDNKLNLPAYINGKLYDSCSILEIAQCLIQKPNKEIEERYSL